MSADLISTDLLRRRIAELEDMNRRSQSNLKDAGGSGTSDGMDRVWEKLAEHDKRFDKTEAKLDKLIETVSELKGRMSASPTTWQLLGIMITTWAAGAAIVFALTKFAR